MAREIKINRIVQGLEQTLEHALDAALRPVGPRPEYLDTLRNRLMQEPDRSGEDEALMKLALGGVGVISVLVLILASLKLVQNMRRGKV
jgi:hypothetical protein